MGGPPAPKPCEVPRNAFRLARIIPTPMNHRLRWLSLFALLATLVAPVLAQEKLTLKASLEPATAKPGDEVKLVLKAVVDPKYHAYGSKESTNIPVGVDTKKLQTGGLELVGKPKVPPGRRTVTFGIETFPLPHEFEVSQQLKVPASLAAGEVTIAGALDYQVCDANSCLPPNSAAFSVKLVVAAAAGEAKSAADPKVQAGGDAKVRVAASFTPATARAGEQVQLVLRVTVDPRYHAYGAKETTNVPVALDPNKQQLGGLERVGDAQIPPGERKEAFGLETFPLPHEFGVTQLLKVPAGTKPGAVAVRGVLDYQICDENSCEPPADGPYEATLVVEAGEARPAAAPANVPLGTKPGLTLTADEKITIQASFVPATARAGETVELVLRVDVVDHTYHAYGSKETTNKPVALDASKQQFGALQPDGEAQVPPGELKVAFGLETFPLPHQFEVRQRLLVPAGTAPGKVAVEGVLDYQLCDENHCELPQEGAYAASLTIEAGAARGAAVAPPAKPETPPKNGAADNLLTGGLWQLILACIGGGLFALVMPCTYPMIPITFSFFTKQADARGGKVMTLALLYGAGIVGMFTLIGVAAGAVADKIVIFSAHWITNVVIGGAFVVFGASLLGLITLQPPAFLMQAAGKGRSVGGALGVLLMGATLVISSFTCTAPVVALLLLPAVQSGDALLPAIGMAVFGLTMALPFVFLALLPGRVKALPRSGEWMNTLKVSLGFVELAAALKFFSNAEYAEDLKILPREVYFAIWIVIFVILGVYLLGLVPRTATGVGRKVGGFASLAFAGYCFYGILGYPLDYVMNAFAPAYSLRDPKPGEVVIDEAGHPLAVDNYEAAVAYAKQHGKLVLVNFTGFTCSNCRMVERGVLPAAAIAPILREHFVEARLHMDNPKKIQADRWAVQDQLRKDLVEGRQTTPTYVTVDPATGKKFVEHILSGGPGAWEAGYLTFLSDTLKGAGRTMPAAK